MRARARLIFLAAVVTLALTATAAHSQAPRGAKELTPAAIADSQAALAQLDVRVRADNKDAAAWHRIGMIAWALAERAKAPNAPRALDATRLGRMADTSLRTASQVAPTNALYKLMVGRFLLSTGQAMPRSSAGGFFEQALDIARKTADSAILVEAAIDVGRARWRKFDGLVNRRIETTPGAAIRVINDAMEPAPAEPDMGDVPMFNMKLVREALERGTLALPADVTGELDYKKAHDLFLEAHAINPSNARALRAVAMVLAERDNWSELEAFARSHLK